MCDHAWRSREKKDRSMVTSVRAAGHVAPLPPGGTHATERKAALRCDHIRLSPYLSEHPGSPSVGDVDDASSAAACEVAGLARAPKIFEVEPCALQGNRNDVIYLRCLPCADVELDLASIAVPLEDLETDLPPRARILGFGHATPSSIPSGIR